jgi:hypothetical protein
VVRGQSHTSDPVKEKPSKLLVRTASPRPRLRDIFVPQRDILGGPILVDLARPFVEDVLPLVAPHVGLRTLLQVEGREIEGRAALFQDAVCHDARFAQDQDRQVDLECHSYLG